LAEVMMRRTDRRSGELFWYVDLEQRVRADHPLRAIREVVSTALAALSRDIAGLYSGDRTALDPAGDAAAGDAAAGILFDSARNGS
jgi:hypothetical protein